MTRIGELGTTFTATSMRRLRVIDNVVHSSPNIVTQMMEALGSSDDTSVFMAATRRNIPEHDIRISFVLL
jgi:hypothetical protein